MSRRVQRLLITLLSVSLVCNFAFAGFIAARVVHDYSYSQVVEFFDAEPSPEVLAQFQDALRADRAAVLGALLELRRARLAAHEALTAEALDPAALEAAHGEVRVAATDLIAVLQTALRQTAAELPDAERRAIPLLEPSELSPGRALTEDGANG